MKFTKTFENLGKNDVGVAGGKGASLGEMTKAGIPVPPGFVVTADAFDKFLKDTDINVEIDAQLDKINPDQMESVDRGSEIIRGLIDNQKMDKKLQKEILKEFDKLDAKYVAVRSSATAEDAKTASWAGELETYLNVTKKDLTERVRKCWGSLFTPRAIFYRIEKGLGGQKISVAVAVQKMIDSEVSGIVFTVHPVTKDKNQMIIEAGWGLGEAIVGGQITPDNYVIDKVDNNIIDINVSEQTMMIVKKEGKTVEDKVPSGKQNKQKLNGKQILELAEICKSIEKHYGSPQDIEWAFESEKFYIVQSRPITTL
ncbi:Phosphoenolpyruvate synthase [subsurface metagenome]